MLKNLIGNSVTLMISGFSSSISKVPLIIYPEPFGIISPLYPLNQGWNV